jgi:acetyltransferase-like isoleucine patch superfamily enzyme
MRFAKRVIKSVRNRAHVGTMRLRGWFTRALTPLVLTGGRRLVVGRNVDIVLYGELCIGVGVTLADGCALEVAPGGRLVIGDHVFIGRHTVIVAAELVEIGDHTLVAEHCTIRDQDHQVDPDERLRETESRSAPVHLASKVWLGAGVRVLRGSAIGEGSIIAANAVVHGEIPARVIAGGIPARVLRSLGDGAEAGAPGSAAPRDIFRTNR